MTWIAVARKEFLENVRNAWILAVAAVFLVLTLGASFFAGAGLGLAGMLATILAMQSTTAFVLPILALMLGFGAIAGEREAGTLGLLAAQPLTRAEILVGKFAGLWLALAAAIVSGIGVASAVVLARQGADARGLAQLAIFLALTLAWAATWTALTLLLSAFFKRRATAIGGAVVAWFLFAVVWSLLEILILVASYGPNALQAPQTLPSPWWLTLLEVLNPNAVYRDLLTTLVPGYVDVSPALASIVGAPAFHWGTFLVAMVAWIALPLAGAHALFVRRDV